MTSALPDPPRIRTYDYPLDGRVRIPAQTYTARTMERAELSGHSVVAGDEFGEGIFTLIYGHRGRPQILRFRSQGSEALSSIIRLGTSFLIERQGDQLAGIIKNGFYLFRYSDAQLVEQNNQ